MRRSDPGQTWSEDPTSGGGGAEGPWTDRYEVVRELGRGGMGRVLLARDTVLERDVAVKVLLSERGRDAFLREARIAAHLEHPAIVPVHDAGITAAGEAWYVMRLVRGRSLAEAMHGATTPAARLGLLDAVVELTRAVAYAHELGVVHRDLKPENVMLGPWGEVQVVDWGLARILAEADPQLRGWLADPQAGRVAGTPAYMAPEQARGEPADTRSDVWALGMILRELLTGDPAWDRTTAPEVVLEEVRGGRVPQLPTEGPPELLAIVGRACRVDPDGRYRDARALASDLVAFRAGARVSAHTYGWREEWRRFDRRFWWPLRAAAGVGLVGLVGLVAAATGWAEAVEKRRDAEGARQDLEVSLRATLLASAAHADRQAAAAEASALAAQVLLGGEDPVARGILARHLGQFPVEIDRVRGRVPAPVSSLRAGPGGAILGGGGGGAWAFTDGRVAWHRPELPQLLAVGEDLSVLGAADRTEVVGTADGGTRWRGPPATRAAVGPGRVLLARGRQLALFDPEGGAVSDARVGSSVSAAFAEGDGFRVWTVSGQSFLLGPDGQQGSWVARSPSAHAAAPHGDRWLVAAVDRGGWIVGPTGSVPLDTPRGLVTAFTAGTEGWVGDGRSVWPVDLASGRLGPALPLPGGALLPDGDGGHLVLGDQLVAYRRTAWRPEPSATGASRFVDVAADGVALRSGKSAVRFDRDTGRVLEEIPAPESSRGIGPVVRSSGRWAIGASHALWTGRGAPLAPQLPGNVIDAVRWRGGWAAIFLDDRVVFAEGERDVLERELPFPTAHATAFPAAEGRIWLTTPAGRWYAVGAGGPIEELVPPGADADLLASPGCGRWWLWGERLARVDHPEEVLRVDASELRDVCAIDDHLVALLDRWSLRVIDRADGHLVAQTSRFETRATSIARVGDDWLWVGRMSGELERFYLPALTTPPEKLAAEVRRRTGFGVRDGAVTPDLPR